MKAYDGSLMLSVKDNWLLLKNAKGAMIGRRGLKTTDSLSIGAKLYFPNHVIRLGIGLIPLKSASSATSAPLVVHASPNHPHPVEPMVSDSTLPMSNDTHFDKMNSKGGAVEA
jgi:hypothetical protein